MSHQLKKLYKKIPKIKCKGLCHPQCTIIGVSKIERKIIIDKLMFDPFMEIQQEDPLKKKYMQSITKCSEDSIRCPMLNMENKCNIYEDRPFVCRIYGVSKMLPCEYGCEPEEWISQMDAAKLKHEIEKL